MVGRKRIMEPYLLICLVHWAYSFVSCRRCCSLPAVGVWIPLEHHVILYYLDVDDNGQNLHTCYLGYLLSSSLLSKNLKIKIYRTVILPVVLYGCETWALTLQKERRLRVFENRVLRRIFGPKRDVLTVEWRKLHNEDLNDLLSSPNIVWL